MYNYLATVLKTALHIGVDCYELGNELQLRLLDRTGLVKTAYQIMLSDKSTFRMERLAKTTININRQMFADVGRTLHHHIDQGPRGLWAAVEKISDDSSTEARKAAAEIFQANGRKEESLFNLQPLKPLTLDLHLDEIVDSWRRGVFTN